MKVLVLGAGGHAQVVADAIRMQACAGADVQFVGYLDDRADALCQTMGDSVRGRLTDWAAVPHDAVIVAIGDNATRKRLFDESRHRGASFTVARHPATTVATDVSIGAGSMLCAGVIINTQTTVGVNTIVNTAATIDHHCRVGSHVHIAPGVHLGGEVEIGDGALIGIGAVVLPRLRVGSWARVGAGAVVVDDVPAGTTVVGVPAKAVKVLCP